MEVLGFQFSEKFERFYEEQKEFLGLEEIVFVPMSEHPNQGLFGGAYGTTDLSEDGRTLKVYLNPDRFNLHPANERNYVAEVIAVHEILHQWTKAQGYPEVRGADCDDWPAVTESFIGLFHHRVITREMDRLKYNYSMVDRFVAGEFVRKNTELKAREAIPEYTPSSDVFSLFTIKYAEYYFKFPPEYYQKAKQLIADSNMNLLLRSVMCVEVIKKTRCWETPGNMFTAMKQVRGLIELQPNVLDFQNPATGKWC